MAQLADVTNELIREEIEEYIQRPDEIVRIVELFARVSPKMQDIAAAIIEGEDDVVDELTTQALAENVDATPAAGSPSESLPRMRWRACAELGGRNFRNLMQSVKAQYRPFVTASNGL